MATRLRRLAAVAALTMLMACGHSGSAKTQLGSSDDALWNRTVKPFLAEPLWEAGLAADAGHYLEIPLRAAFADPARAAWRQQLADHFARFADTFPKGMVDVELDRLHYLYLASQFLVLAKQGNMLSLVPPKLPGILAGELRREWLENPAWEYQRPDFPSMRDRVLWKLTNPTVDHSYYISILQEEQFTFALAADLATVDRLAGQPINEVSANALAVAEQVYKARGSFLPLGGWIFDRGAMWDHPDYAYAGQPEKVEGMRPAPIRDIARDSSHSDRTAMWLSSQIAAYPPGSPQAVEYTAMRAGLIKQFTTTVLVRPGTTFSCWRATNYMDGRNGVYRWEHKTQGPGNGFGPFELSGTLTLGWWAGLGPAAKPLYDGLRGCWPLSSQVLATYVGPNTTRERDPLVSDPDSYTNGFRELIVRLASGIAERGS